MKTVEDITGLEKPTLEDYLREQDKKPEDDCYDAYVDNLEAYAYNLGKFIERQEAKKEGLLYGDLNEERQNVFEAEQKPFFLLRRLEYELLKYWKDKGYKYIARDSDLTLYIYKEEPFKNNDVWATEYGHAERHSYFDNFFSFIEWTDKYPFDIEELLNTSEVVEND